MAEIRNKKIRAFRSHGILPSVDDRLNLYFPLWIDGGLGRELYAGARAIRDYLAPRMSFGEIRIDEPCDPRLVRDVVGYAAIVGHLDRASTALRRIAPERIFTVGGGCGIEVPLVSYLRRKYPALRVLWLDAHGDLNSPASSPSKHFHGMPLRFLLEGGLDDAIGDPIAILDPSSVALIGCQDLDPPEADYIRERGIQIIGVEDSGSADPVALGAPVYVHLDLDVLDPGAYPNVKCPVPGGMSVADVAALVGRVAAGGDLVGMSVLENLARDRETISRLEPIFALAERI